MPALHAPELTDGVARVRGRRDDDRGDFIRACQDPEISRWTSVPSPYGEAEWESWRVESARQAAAGEGLHMVIADAEDLVIGAVGLNSVDWEAGTADIGYWVAPWGRGRGAAARATRLVADWATGELGLRDVTVIVHPDNHASQRTAVAAGFRDAGRRGPCPRQSCERDSEDHIVFVNSR